MEEKAKESVAVFNGIEMRISSLDDIWLTQKQIAQVFETSVQNVSKHVIALKKELANWEGLSMVINRQLITTPHGAIEEKTQTKAVEVYGFDFICQIGFKVDSVRGFKFRQFVTEAVREKLNRDLLNRDEKVKALMNENNALKNENNALKNENNTLKARLGEAVMEISGLEMNVDYLKQYEPAESDYGKLAKNGYPRTTYQKGGFKSRGGRKVELRPQYVTIDLLAVAKYLQ